MTVSKSFNWQIEQADNKVVVHLSGDLTRNTLSPLWAQRGSLLSNYACDHIHWDLNEVAIIDSAGLALLVELLHLYQNKINYLINLPKSINDLAILFGLEDWLNTFKL